MSLLGSVGQLYMLALLTLLFLGFGFAIWSAVNHLIDRTNKKVDVGKANNKVNIIKNQIQSNKQIIGGYIMANNGWLKLAAFSFVGILISFAVLGLLTTNSMTGSSAHLQHQQPAMNSNGMNNMQMAGMQGSMNMNNMQMGNMQMPGMQGNMNMSSMNGIPMSNTQMPGMQNGMNMPMGGMQMNSMNMGGNDMMLMLQNMQMQMNQMQQQLNMMNSGSMSNGSMSNGSSMGGSSGGGMGMMMGGMM